MSDIFLNLSPLINQVKNASEDFYYRLLHRPNDTLWFYPDAEICFIIKNNLLYGPLKGINKIKKTVSNHFADKYFRISSMSLNQHKQLFKLSKNEIKFETVKNVINFQNEFDVLIMLKNLGNQTFEQGIFCDELTLKSYTSIIKRIQELTNYCSNKNLKQLHALAAKVHNNISAVYYRKKLLELSKTHCLLALKLQPNYEKVQKRLNNIKLQQINN